MKIAIAQYAPLKTILWFWEELNCGEVNQILVQRIKSGEPIELTYGKLMDRLTVINDEVNKNSKTYSYQQQTKNLFNSSVSGTQQKENTTNSPLYEELLTVAEEKLKNYKMILEEPVVVLGDASSSMQVAVRTSTIIASLLCRICHADLRFFRSNDEYIKNPPTNVRGVLELGKKCIASGCTSPAASLYPYYALKKKVKTFIVVTDEEENLSFNNILFAPLFKKYYHEVYPARVVFISFLSHHKEGHMVTALKKEMPNLEITWFMMHNQRPDLTKLDNILNTLAVHGEYSNVNQNEDKNQENVNKMTVHI